MRPYHRPIAPTWWLTNRAYFFFMIRELTSVFIAAYLVLFLLMLRKLTISREAYQAYLQFLATPGMLVFHVLALGLALYHAVTWFNITPKVLIVRFGEERVPATIVAGVNFAAWIVVSVIIAWIVLRS